MESRELAPPTRETAAALSLLLLTLCAPLGAVPTRPNIGYFLIDDMGHAEADWKLLLNPGEFRGNNRSEPGELYNVTADLAEKPNLAAENPERVKARRARLRSYLENSAKAIGIIFAAGRGGLVIHGCGAGEVRRQSTAVACGEYQARALTRPWACWPRMRITFRSPGSRSK